MSEMVERVKAAIAERRRVAPYEDEDLARAAIKAMREPTEAMEAVVDEKTLNDLDFGWTSIGQVYRAMISAALGEKPE